MKVSKIVGFLGISLLAVLLAMTLKVSSSTEGNSGANEMTDANAPADVEQSFGKLPLAFEANEGQTDDAVQFMARGPGYGLFLTGERLALALDGPDETGFGLHLVLDGANPEAQAEGIGRLPGTSNYFKGSDPQQWQTNVAQYRKVRYDEVWPGIDVVYYGKQGQLEYDFVVEPDVDPSAISMSFDGAEAVSLVDGELVLATAAGDVVLREPVLYQEHEGYRARVDGRYALLADNQVNFEIGDYDPNRELIIDPVLLYSTFIGGAGGTLDSVVDLELDADDNVYFTGITNAPDFPTTSGTGDGGSGAQDAFVGKLNADGTTLLWSTFLRGSGHDAAADLVLDASGNVYVTGFTQSTDFPTTSGAFQTARNGTNDGFVTKLDPTGSTLLYSTYIGGGGTSEGLAAIEVDAQGKIYVGGATRATNYPTTAGAFDTGANGLTDLIFSIIDPAGGGASDLVYSTYMGTNAEDKNGIVDLVLDAAGDVYMVGGVGCGAQQFPNGAPIPSTAIDPVCGPAGTQIEGFAAKLSPDGNGADDLLWATYLGGDGNRFESADNAELDPDGNLVVVGLANPDGNAATPDFPTTPGAFDPVGDLNPAQGKEDVFVVKISPDGSSLLFGTFIAGVNRDGAADVAIDDAGNIFVAGTTQSSDMPTVAPYQAALSGVVDAWLGKLSADGSTLLFSTYFGCSSFEFALALELDASGTPVIAGNTRSSDFPITPGAYQTSMGGSRDAFITKMDISAPGTHTCGDPVPPPPTSNQDPDCSLVAIADQSADASCSAAISGADVTGVTDPDNDPLTITVSPTNLVLGANTVTVTADDGNGGTCSTDIAVIVVDNTAPVVACPANISVDAPANACAAIVTFTATASDNCGNATVVATPASGSSFPLGSTTVNVTATDDSGNQSSCSFDVSVNDVTAPEVTAQFLPLDSGDDDDDGDDGKVKLCHKPGTNAEKTLEVPASAVPGHLGHGDVLGECDDNENKMAKGKNDKEEDKGGDSKDKGDFQISFSGTDLCDASPDVSAVILIPAIPANAVTEFEAGDDPLQSSIKFRFDAKKGTFKISLEGTDEATLRAQLADAIASGGFAVLNNQVLQLESKQKDNKDEYKFEFNNGILEKVKFESGDPAIMMKATATDASGNSSMVTVDAFTGATMAAAQTSAMQPSSYAQQAVEAKAAASGKTDSAELLSTDSQGGSTSGTIPEAFALAQNYPNPFNPSTTIAFAVPEGGEVTLTIYNMRGQFVQTLYSGGIAAGQHSRVWDGRDFRGTKVASGVYIYQLKAKGFVATKKLLFEK